MNCRRGVTPAADESPLDSGQVELDEPSSPATMKDATSQDLKTEALEPIRSAEGLGRVTQS